MKSIKPKKCKNCGEKFTPERPLQYVCSPKCGYEYARKLSDKKEKKELKELKESLLTKGHYEKILQQLINKIVRTIDNGQPCIATGSTNGKMNAGHFYSVGSNPTIRYHLDNIHIQSEHSNTYKSGDTLRYIDGLKNVYGESYFNYVLDLKKIPPLKLSLEELKDFITKAKQVLKELPEDMVYEKEKRLELRKKYNLFFGIYE
jgi:hypothetical protein